MVFRVIICRYLCLNSEYSLSIAPVIRNIFSLLISECSICFTTFNYVWLFFMILAALTHFKWMCNVEIQCKVLYLFFNALKIEWYCYLHAILFTRKYNFFSLHSFILFLFSSTDTIQSPINSS